MTPLTDTDLRDLIGIASAVLSPFIGAVVAVWTYRSQFKERLAVQIVWGHTPDQNNQPEECPFLYVQNQSDRPIAVVEICYLKGTIFRSRKAGTALYYEDPFFDLDFPYLIEAGQSQRFKLSEYGAKAITDEATNWQRVIQRLRPMVWLEIKTLANAKIRIPAWDATPWKNRAKWLR